MHLLSMAAEESLPWTMWTLLPWLFLGLSSLRCLCACRPLFTITQPV
jgi:hypothetical protein